jgi:hypothetical protein
MKITLTPNYPFTPMLKLSASSKNNKYKREEKIV